MSGGRWLPYRHMLHCTARITAALAAGNARLIVNLPPGHGKSDLFSFWFPIWYLDNFPARAVGVGAYAADIAKGYGRRIRNEVAANPLVGVKLAEDSKSAGIFHTNRGGAVFCVGVDSALLSRRLNLMVVDDPHKNWAEAFSSTVRAATQEWFFSTVTSRLEPGASVIVVGQRFHPDDLHGVLARTGDWKVIRLPALAEAGDPLGRAEGEPLCPERYDAKALAIQKRDLRSQARWDAMYQQAPTGYGTGCLYERFSERNLDPALEPDPRLPLCVNIDFNIRPGMHIELGQYRELTGTFTVFDEIHAEALDLNGAMDLLVAWLRPRPKFPEIQVFGDAAGYARSVQVTQSCYDLVQAKLRAAGLGCRLRVPRDAPAVRDSVDALNDALLGVDSEVRFFVHPRCARLLADFRLLQRDASGLIDKRNLALSHASDAVRYWVHYLRPVGMLTVPNRPRGRVLVAGGSM